jgi:glycosyltransferase involved in cell wall biosynthesis
MSAAAPMSIADSAETVSVITPCYNAAPFVEETIAAVAAQTYATIEHILVDDGSQDGTWDILQAHRDRVTLLRSPANRGGAHARNRGTELARGAFLMYLDADDVIGPDAIGALVDAVRGRPGTIGYCPWLRLRQVNGAWQSVPPPIPLPAPDADALHEWLNGIGVPPCAVLWRRDVYEATGGWDESLTLNDDTELMMRALVRGARLVRADGGAVYYREHPDTWVSVSRDLSSEDRLRSAMRSYQKVAAELRATGGLDKYALAIGRAFQQLAEIGFREGYRANARECLEFGRRFAGTQAVSRTWMGRFMTKLIGLELKELLFNACAYVGIGRRERRSAMRRRRNWR